MNYSNIKNLKKIVDSTGGVDYSGLVVYENGAVKRVMFDGGYATFADVGKGASVQPYKFGGKELDAMYGLNIYDFHARTQTPDLARFTRPDPLAEKTPHLSPYLFCANDPVNNIDPTGIDIVIYGDDNEKYWHRQLADKTYGFVNSSEELYSGNSEKIEEISLGLQTLQSGDVGNALVESLISNKNELRIDFSTEKNDGNSFSESSTIKWNPYDMFCGLSMEANGGYTPFAPSYISLGHELAHAEDFFSGSMDYSTWYSYNGYSVEYNELKACHVENMIRAEHNIPLRTHYSRTQFDNPVEKSRVMIAPQFQPIFRQDPKFSKFQILIIYETVTLLHHWFGIRQPCVFMDIKLQTALVVTT